MTSTYKRRAPNPVFMHAINAYFDADALKRVCEMDQAEFEQYAHRIDLDDDAVDQHERYFYYRDNGSDVLAVAHLDTVQKDRTCQIVDTGAGKLALSGALDDRLGAYVILELLPKLGITCDWLLTIDEEMGDSTARAFESPKPYNWIIEFDRGGTDVVMYQYETDELADLVDDAGARVGMGSYSDIAELEHLGCAALNWGVGYEDYHSARSHAWLDDTFRMVARFMTFYQANADTYLRHTPRPRWGTWQDREDSMTEDELEAWWEEHGADFDEAEDAEEVVEEVA